MDSAKKLVKAFKNETRLLSDLETVAAYETPFYLRYPVTLSVPFDEAYDTLRGNAGKTKEEAEAWLNEAETQVDTLAYSFMDALVDTDTGFMEIAEKELGEAAAKQFQIDVANGLIKHMAYRLEDDQSGKIRMETTRKLTGPELDFMKLYWRGTHNQQWADMQEEFNTFLGHAQIIDVWNTWGDTSKQTTFEFSEVPLEKDLETFTDAVADLSVEQPAMEQ